MVIAAALVLTASCVRPTELQVDETSVSFTREGGTQAIHFTTNKSWTAYSSAQWCTVSVASGKKGAISLDLKAEPNTSYEPRECTVTVKAEELSREIHISQGMVSRLEIDQDLYEIDIEGGRIECKMTTNIEYDVIVDSQSAGWIHKDQQSSESIVFIIDACDLMVDREGKVTVEGDGLSCEIVIHQYSTKTISFADADLKSALAAAFDKNDDGEISMAEAASATSLDGVFGENRKYTSFDELRYFTGLTEISDNLFSQWELLSSVVLPETIVTIGERAFNQCKSLNGVELPGALKEIKNYAFNECISLTSVSFPEGIQRIGYYAYYRCTSLYSITIPSRKVTIESGSFFNCSNTVDVTTYLCTKEALEKFIRPEHINLTILPGITVIPARALMAYPQLASVSLPETVKSLGDYAFALSALTSINLPDSIESIGYQTFMGSSINSIIFPKNITKIPDYAFQSCSSLASIVIHDGVTSIGNFAFSMCSALSDIAIPEGVTSIGDHAFQSCSGLSSIVIPSSVTRLGGRVFAVCKELKSATILAKTPPVIAEYASFGAGGIFLQAAECPIFVPDESVEAYKAANGWDEYADRIKPLSEKTN